MSNYDISVYFLLPTCVTTNALFEACLRLAAFDKNEICARKTAMTISLHFDVISSETALIA